MSDVYSIKYDVESNTDGTKTCTVKWNIKGFYTFLEAQHARYISDICTNMADCAGSANADSKILFKIVFAGKKSGYIEFYCLAPVSMSLKFLLYCKNGYLDQYSKKEYFKVQPNKWQFMTGISYFEFMCTRGIYAPNNQPISDFIYRSGELYLCFEITIKKEIEISSPKAELNADLENLFNNSIYSDVTIKSAEGVEFKTHKAVLVARSAVLKAHFDHNFVESLTNTIDTPLETEVLQEVIRYIYTDNAPKIYEMADKLLAAADYFQLSRLKHLCEEALFKKLTDENAIATLQIADLHSATKLKHLTLAFILNGRAE